jgi:carbonic anhydrase/acetyltransferase-like protein (isoleucine patch superfamily)
MSAGPATALAEAQGRSPPIASSTVVVGTARLGEGSLLAEGAVIRSEDAGVEIRTGPAVLENSVAIGNTTIPTTIGRRTTLGHRCKLSGATVGDLCEIGNASTLMPGAQLGARATNARARAEARSSHCASSTTQSSGRSSAASDSRPRTASPTRKVLGACPVPSPRAIAIASRCGSGRRSRSSRLGEHSC